MPERSLLKWGGICAYAAGIIIIVASASMWIGYGGIPSQVPDAGDSVALLSGGAWRTALVAWGASLFVSMVVFFAIYDYLKKTSYGLATVGLGFALAWLIVMAVLMPILAAGKVIALIQSPGYEQQLFLIMIMFGCIHRMLLLIAIAYPLCWGLAFLKGGGNARITGILLLATAVFYSCYYVFERLGSVWTAEFFHLLGHIPWIVSHFTLGLVLTAAARKEHQTTGGA